jgi:hypothetical protein
MDIDHRRGLVDVARQPIGQAHGRSASCLRLAIKASEESVSNSPLGAGMQKYRAPCTPFLHLQVPNQEVK